MVVFMDQLSAQTPPMKDNVPVIGQVSKNHNQLSIFDFHSLVFCWFLDYNFIFNDKYNLLSTVTSYGWTACVAILASLA